MNESACSIPAKRSRALGAHSAARPYAPSTCSHSPRSRHTSATPARSSIRPTFVVPAVATTANTPSPPSASSAARSAAPVSRPPSAGTSSAPASITRSIDAHRGVHLGAAGDARRRSAPACRARARAACRAERFPFVPPWTKQPPAESGSPARPASQRSASFSACTAPDPSSHEPP